jgi:NAD(P)-dependent dehydrogenase (short-subunit alcohol dehydrogenase family)
MPDKPKTEKELSGEVAIVTGGAQGLGLGIAAELARQGATVVIGDIQAKKAKQEAQGLSEQGFQVEAAELDIADSRQVDGFFEMVVARHKRLDILVNNAGVGQKVVPIVELSDEEWDRVIGITLTGIFYCARAAGRIMERQCSGTIVNISSINGQNPAALVAAYNVAKAGVISLTQTLALELAAYGIRVNAICPGPVYTEFNKSVMAQRCQSLGIKEDQMIERVRSAVPLGRWGEPEDIANMVAFLCGPRSAWMTGDVVRVSGGLAGVSAAPPRRTSDK